MLEQSLIIILDKNSHKIDDIFRVRGKKKAWFSHNKNDLRRPGRIKEHNLYYERCFSAHSIVKVIQKVLKNFNYSPDEFEVFTNEN